jgi:hypothetical protein
MTKHPMGEGFDPNPRIVAEKLVDPAALNMGITAENLHDRFPHLTRERADAYGVASQEKYAKALADGRSSKTWCRSRSGRARRAGVSPSRTSRRAPARPWRASPTSRPRSGHTAGSPLPTPHR